MGWEFGLCSNPFCHSAESSGGHDVMLLIPMRLWKKKNESVMKGSGLYGNGILDDDRSISVSVPYLLHCILYVGIWRRDGNNVLFQSVHFTLCSCHCRSNSSVSLAICILQRIEASQSHMCSYSFTQTFLCYVPSAVVSYPSAI